MIGSSQISLLQDPYEQVIQKLLRVKGRQKRRLQGRENTLENKKSAISDIGSKITSFNSLLDKLKDPFSDKITPLAGQSSNKEAVSVLSTKNMENTGNYNITVSSWLKMILSSPTASQAMEPH